MKFKINRIIVIVKQQSHAIAIVLKIHSPRKHTCTIVHWEVFRLEFFTVFADYLSRYPDPNT